MKQVDTNEYISMLCELTEQGAEVQLPVRGNSMAPFLIGGRDEVCFRKPDRPLHRGDIVLFRRKSGKYVLHRICRIQNGAYYLAGDAQRMLEGPIAEQQVVGLVTRAWRKGKWIGRESLLWQCFAHIWIWLLPLREGLMKGYGRIRKQR